ncbi:MAG TPA: exosortase [Pyrinomonadaceae bacterium]
MAYPIPRNLWKPLLVAAAIGFLYSAVLARLGFVWWNDDNYSHGLLVPLIIGYILWTERESLARVAKRPSVLWGGALVVGAWLMLWAGTAGAELFTQRVSLVVMLLGVTVYFWGFRLLRFVFAPLLLLALAIPIPTIIFNKIAFPLQLFASRCAVAVMRLFDIPVLREGNVIELMPLNSVTTKKLEVVEACSGIRSLMTLVTLAVVFAYFTSPTTDDTNDGGRGSSNWSPRRWAFWRALIIVLSAVPIAIVTNAARVSGTGALAHFYGTQVADGFFHSFSGWIVYVVAALLLFGVGWLLDRIGGGDDNNPRAQRDATDAAQTATHEDALVNVVNREATETASIANAPPTALPLGTTKAR